MDYRTGHRIVYDATAATFDAQPNLRARGDGKLRVRRSDVGRLFEQDASEYRLPQRAVVSAIRDLVVDLDAHWALRWASRSTWRPGEWEAMSLLAAIAGVPSQWETCIRRTISFGR